MCKKKNAAKNMQRYEALKYQIWKRAKSSDEYEIEMQKMIEREGF